ncbi:MAG: hypothetical protein KDJ86_18705 [Bauldia sp.]|nr:hypothetical protein [Bauldia sp.]
MGLLVAGFLSGPQAATAQDAIQAPASKQIGKTTGEDQAMVPSLIVMNARGATLTSDTLTLDGVAPNLIIFADRPVRAAGHMLVAHMVEDWAVGNDSFGEQPPNATVSVFSETGDTVTDAVVVLKSPKLEGDKLTFAVEVLEGDLQSAKGAAAVFVDIFGVRRRAFRRGAYYGAAVGAAATAGVAATAAVAAAPYYPPPPAAYCGYYPYPPCY